MKRTATALTITLVFLAVALASPFCSANPGLSIKNLTYNMTVTLLSPKNNTVSSVNYLLLNFSIRDIPSETIRSMFANDSIFDNILFEGFARIILDGNNNVTFAQYPISFHVVQPQPSFYYSFNLTNIPEGEHSIVAKVSSSSEYSLDLDGVSLPTNITIIDTVAPEPFPSALVIAVSGASLAVVGIGLLVYFKKHKLYHNKNKLP
jgi:hypothetical protein